ncbi:Ribosomal protein L11 methyltransferase [Alteripontixanthobacter maritimus]|uniref:Ribosomal protein L11 methyltransferase n=1 Tax=Alteripontixanthobacter maritimus TaxID=2161824 RepID=A0A369Q5Y8_9SPHN|nr:50S ribosomal protein L11 methyltransferase [Alteripontixanthobacter maritimus]RDC60134.1 Ribosomal protein L11 methyltransferase [Alteripontixanthobacter maritimus]
MSADNAWKMTAFASKAAVETALLAHDTIDDWDADIVVSGSEVAKDRPDDWQLEAWLPRKPNAMDRKVVAGLFGVEVPDFTIEKLPDEDWVTTSQQGVEPIRAGPFHVHTPEHRPLDEPGVVNFAIPASQAFGTGQHETTAGCLEMLAAMRGSGVMARDVADIGTGTGLLGFAALALWPATRLTLSDIDEVCGPVVAYNAMENGVPNGHGRGAAMMVVAAGMDHPLIEARAPYDLLIANILAGPLVELAPDFAENVTTGGNLLLAGLLETQEAAVRRSYRRAGFRLAGRIVNGDWSILWLRKRRGF